MPDVFADVPLAPSCVKASNVTSTAAAISWLPSNSNFSHVVAVNSVEMKCLKPGCFRHLVSGLAPNTSYRVSVRAKPGRLLLCGFPDDSKAETRRVAGMLTAFVDFRTLPKGDAPVCYSRSQNENGGGIFQWSRPQDVLHNFENTSACLVSVERARAQPMHGGSQPAHAHGRASERDAFLTLLVTIVDCSHGCELALFGLYRVFDASITPCHCTRVYRVL